MSASTRALRKVGIVAAGCWITGCTSQAPYGSQQHAGDACGPGKTLYCEERINEVIHCTCDSEDAMKEIFERQRR